MALIWDFLVAVTVGFEPKCIDVTTPALALKPCIPLQ